MKNKGMYDSSTCFSTYLKRGTEKAIFIDKLKRKIIDNPSFKIETLLDIGCHDGELTLWYLNEIKSHCSDKCIVDALDPSIEALYRFKSRELPNQFQFNFLNFKIEDFIFNQAKIKYNFLVASHCLYWTKDLSSAVRAIHDCADRSVIVLRENIGIYEIQKQFSVLIGNKDEQLYTAENINQVLTENSINFEREIIHSEIELPPLGSQAYEDLIGFFLQTKVEAIPVSYRIEIDNLLKSKNGRFKHDVSFFWLGK